MPYKDDPRGSWTLKHAGVTPELLTRARMAAKRQGSTTVGWVVDVINEAALRVLAGGGAPPDAPPAGLPATLRDVADPIADLRAEMRAGFDALRQQQAPQQARTPAEMRRDRMLRQAAAKGRRRAK